MTEQELWLPKNLPASAVPARIEAVCQALGLSIIQNTTLAQYPGSQHWHLKLGRQPGTLEVTWWPAQRRAWFKIAAGRQGAWMAETIHAFQQSVSTETPQHV